MKEESTFLQVFLTHRAALVNYAAPIVGRARAEDVVQEAYIRFSQPQNKTVSHPVGYLYRIVRNLAIDRRRHLKAENLLPDTQIVEHLQSDAPSAEQSALYRDELRVLAEALSELPPRTRLAFKLHRLEGLTLQQVADRLNISVVRAHQLVKTAVMYGARRLDTLDE